MKLSDFLREIGRPVAYYPNLRKVTGSTTATLFLCQFIYWTGKEASGDGWIYKTADEIEIETGLSYEEQRTAREKLVKSDLLAEQYKRLDHQMFFKVNMEKLDEIWDTRNGKSQIPEMGIPQFGNKALPSSLNSNTENTAENTGGREDTKKRGDLVQMYIDMSTATGIKKQNRIDNLENLIHARLGITPTRRGWKPFLEFVDNQQQKEGKQLNKFLDWLISQPKFDVSFWSPERMRESWDLAFPAVPVARDDDGSGGFYV